MIPQSYGDLARSFSTRLHQADLRQQFDALTAEIASGQAADLARHLGPDAARLADLDRRLALGTRQATANHTTAATLSTMQDVLARLDSLRGDTARALIAVTATSTDLQVETAAATARAAFSDAVAALNHRIGATSLFAGTATESDALAPAASMLADLRAACAGAVTVADVTAAVDLWFDDPAGGFAIAGYLGDTGDLPSRSLGDGEAVTIPARASDPAFRDLLKGLAVAALATDPALALPGSTASGLVAAGGARLLSTASGLTASAAALGIAQDRVATATTRIAATNSAIGILRTEMVAADPYAAATALSEVQSRIETLYAVIARRANLSLTSWL